MSADAGGRSGPAAAAVVAAATIVLAVVAGACRAEPKRDPLEASIPSVSVDTAPWVVNERGTVEESAPGSGIFLLEPGSWRARLPDEHRRHGLAVVFSGRPQPEPPGWPGPGRPFMLTSIRRERSAWDSFLDVLGGRDREEAHTQPFMR